MRALPLASLFLLSCGVYAGWRCATLLPPQPFADEPAIWTEDYKLVRKAADAFEVADGHWLRVPRLYADFDLQMDVELAEHTDLDLLVRQVEPRLVQGRFSQFHGRFAALRVTTGSEGKAWLSREEALFGERGRGASLAPGLTATVWVEGRGRTLRANVAGKAIGEFEAMDDYGTLTLAARGGKAVLHRFVITSRGQPRAWPANAWFWIAIGAAGAGLVLAVGLMRGARPLLLVLLGVLVALSGHLLADDVVVLPLTVPSPGPMLALFGGMFVFLAAVLVARDLPRSSVRLLVTVALCAAFAFVAGSARAELCPAATPEIDAVFGPDAGSTLSEAHAQLIRGPLGLHGPAAADAKGKRVLLLGGQLLYGRLRAVDEHLEPLVRGQLRAALPAPHNQVDVLSLPTQDGHTAQQWAMFTRFFTGHRPRAIVFGVPRDEAVVDATLGKPRSYPSTLTDTLRQARAWAKANGAAVVVFTEAGLPRELFEVLQAAERDGVPLVVAGEADAPAAIAKRLAAALLPLLQ